MPATPPPGPGTHALRVGRNSCTGQIYLVTFTTYHRRRPFSDFERACRMARAMHEHCRESATKVLAWVLMPDHWHGLVELAEGDALGGWVGRLKGASAFELRRRDAGVGRIWADGFHDHALRADEELVECARYVVLNPVRAGLVARVGDYSIWDAAWLDSWAIRLKHRG